MISRSVAYFSMEIAVEPGIPTYAGGLGILAGDTVRAASDLGVPMVAVTLLHRKGYFGQRLDSRGRQTESPMEWPVADHLELLEPRTRVRIEDRDVEIQVWSYTERGVSGFEVPVLFLDTDLEENDPRDRDLTHYLYGGNNTYRLSQEIVLGIGGVRMLRALGHQNLSRFHMNEGHASLLTIQLLHEERAQLAEGTSFEETIERVRDRCVFTTHTPVPTGHDQFPIELVKQVLGTDHPFLELSEKFALDVASKILDEQPGALRFRDLVRPGVRLNMTYLGLHLSDYVNGVAKRHSKVSQQLLGEHRIDAITNGVHAATWASRPFVELFDRHIDGWRSDNSSLRAAMAIPQREVWRAHEHAKQELVDLIVERTGQTLDRDLLTLGFARRSTSYKRPGLIFTDIDRLARLAEEVGGLQLVFAGKAHPSDEQGKQLIETVFDAQAKLAGCVEVVFLENYDMLMARSIVSGVDVWLNTPLAPCEASGTSGMKAAINGVPSLSILDGWWIEGCLDGLTGWSIGDGEQHVTDAEDAKSLYGKLEYVVAPLFYRRRSDFVDIMRNSIALNGSYFNTHRMLQQYVLKAYFL